METGRLASGGGRLAIKSSSLASSSSSSSPAEAAVFAEAEFVEDFDMDDLQVLKPIKNSNVSRQYINFIFFLIKKNIYKKDSYVKGSGIVASIPELVEGVEGS